MHSRRDAAAPATPRLIAVAWPLLIELVLGIGVGVVSTLLAARISDGAAAAFALANQVAAALFVLFRIIGAGVSVVVTQCLGGGRRDRADAVARATLGASSWLGGFCALMALVAARPLMGLMQAPAEVAAMATPFLQALSVYLLLDAWNAAASSVLRAHLRLREVLTIIVTMHLLNLFLAYAFVHGLGTLPALGLPGFAIALAASRAFGLSLHLWCWRTRLQLVPRLADWWRLPRQELAAVLQIGLPGAVENIAYRMAFTVSVAVVGQLGAAALATQAYAQQISALAMLSSWAIGLAVEIVVGHLIGAGQLHAAHRLVVRALGRGLILSVVVVGCIALAGPWLMRGFSADPLIIAAGAGLLWWSALIEPGRTFNLVLVNALRASGDARFPVLTGLLSMPLVLAGGSWWLAIHLGWGLTGVWIAYAADEWLRGLINWWRWQRRGWVPKARAAHRRLRSRPADDAVNSALPPEAT
jgi:putative MATE family efflux protein